MKQSKQIKHHVLGRENWYLMTKWLVFAKWLDVGREKKSLYVSYENENQSILNTKYDIYQRLSKTLLDWYWILYIINDALNIVSVYTMPCSKRTPLWSRHAYHALTPVIFHINMGFAVFKCKWSYIRWRYLMQHTKLLPKSNLYGKGIYIIAIPLWHLDKM